VNRVCIQLVFLFSVSAWWVGLERVHLVIMRQICVLHVPVLIPVAGYSDFGVSGILESPRERLEQYEGISKSFRTDRLERELQMVQLSATRCSCITILWVTLVSFAAITLCVASQRVFVVVVYFVIDSVRKLVDTPSCLVNSPFIITLIFRWLENNLAIWYKNVKLRIIWRSSLSWYIR
jgi:hypothetical protein